jgi:hypothetical protein
MPGTVLIQRQPYHAKNDQTSRYHSPPYITLFQ